MNAHVPTVAEVERIAALDDPTIRNLQITQCYHELALAVAQRTGGGANWCAFATWASKQAGQTIRKEDFARVLENIVRPAPVAMQAVPDVVASAQALGSPQSDAQIQGAVNEMLNPLAAVERASLAVGRGNRKVFEEIGREFARFAAECLNDTIYDEAKIARFCDGLRPGEPPHGQQLLQQAFTRCYRALFEPDAKTRAELLLLANLEIGLHEQTRLQPEIAAAMDAAIVDPRSFRGQLINVLFPRRGWLTRARLFLARLTGRRSLLDRALDALLAEAKRLAHGVITEYMMTLEMPGGARLRLGADVPGTFPPALQQITLPDLGALLARYDPTPDSPHESGARDWARLPDRLHYIADLFRCYHERAALFDPPFSAEQVAAFKVGRLPQGRL